MECVTGDFFYRIRNDQIFRSLILPVYTKYALKYHTICMIHNLNNGIILSFICYGICQLAVRVQDGVDCRIAVFVQHITHAHDVIGP